MELQGKRALVTGVTGKVGGAVGLRLMDAGVRVRALIRKPEQRGNVESMGFEPVLGELTDERSLAAALDDVQLVVHCAADLSNDKDLARAANVDGVAILAKLALAAQVERFVHISTLVVYGDSVVFGFWSEPGRQIDESHPLLPADANLESGMVDSRGPYALTKAQGEHALAKVAAEGLPTVVLRPGAIGGEHNSRWGDDAVRRIAAADSIEIFHPEDLVAWIHVDNLADMIVLVATEEAAVGEAYHAVDGNFRVLDCVSRIAGALGKPVVHADRPPMCTVFSNDKILRLGYRPRRSWEENVDALERMAQELASARH